MSVHGMENLLSYAMDLYLALSSKRPDIAKEYFEALASDVALQTFLETYSSPFLDYDDIALAAARAVAKSDARQRRDSRKKDGDERSR
jgi:hypothetical protein